MDKVSLSLGRINNSMQVKICLILRDDKPIVGQELINKFEIGGNKYITVNPHPFIVIDISSKKDNRENGWDSNNSVNITRPFVRPVVNMLKASLEHLKIEDMFYLNDGKLFVNKQRATENVEKVAVRNKYIKVYPVVISDETDKDEYEGLAFMINDPSHYCYLTIDECVQLIDILEETNMTQLSLSLMSIASDMKTAEVRKLERTFKMATDTEPPVENKLIKPSSDKSEMDDIT